MVKYECFRCGYNTIHRNSMKQHLNRKKVWATEDIGAYQEYLLTTLYKHYPVRNDFHDMKVISKREYNKLSNDDKKKK